MQPLMPSRPSLYHFLKLEKQPRVLKTEAALAPSTHPIEYLHGTSLL